jgi:hypothetical protein
MSCIETNDFAFQITEFMHEPRRIERIATEYRLPKEEARSFRPLKVWVSSSRLRKSPGEAEKN